MDGDSINLIAGPTQNLCVSLVELCASSVSGFIPGACSGEPPGNATTPTNITGNVTIPPTPGLPVNTTGNTTSSTPTTVLQYNLKVTNFNSASFCNLTVDSAPYSFAIGTQQNINNLILGVPSIGSSSCNLDVQTSKVVVVDPQQTLTTSVKVGSSNLISHNIEVDDSSFSTCVFKIDGSPETMVKGDSKNLGDIIINMNTVGSTNCKFNITLINIVNAGPKDAVVISMINS